MSDQQFQRGEAILQSLVRGDAMIGVIADVPAAEREMLDALRAAASKGSGAAYHSLGTC